ncbi:bifunctional dethiobiotin synthetase/7,8-diamino-pelargonic acid aminotransferase, mitochondrial [Coffea eugenioides]|uniref:bifunctional dethiobiotin synthetase/7,8-diamino-pelargonic acid aminotransferase, mitochondrial n=1 Tax=Coffea eugenioides TaxID=49369 RepID=UPI000F612A06|nr:bifunctional dethiobiotin synthetase/7,8-diamino-pelargonic acid aminotransferase, mitochondrial [Coffea eugenioides]
MLLLATLSRPPVRRRLLPICLLHHRNIHAQPPPAPPPPPTIEYPLSHPIYAIWAANTSLGKTLVSAGLSITFLNSSCSSKSKKFVYLKPVQTGFPEDSDSRFVYCKFSQFSLQNRPKLSVFASNHVINTSFPALKALLGEDSKYGSFGSEKVGHFGGAFENLGWYEETKLEGAENDEAKGVGLCSELICKTIYGWKEPISPHLASEREGARVEDSELLEVLMRGVQSGDEEGGDRNVDVMCVIETAGGVASPGPSGTLQCDLYRPLRLPAILVGDGRLGGISGTISAYESLKLRGYDVVAIVFEDHGLTNEVPLSSYLQNRIPLFVLPPVPQDMSNDLVEWFEKSQTVFSSLKDVMLSAFLRRVRKLHHMRKKACDILWWPFTQHEFVSEGNVTVIDSRCGENFAVHKTSNLETITQQFDACASWWTQGPDANLQIELARIVGYTIGRYGHVMFPENVYEPVLECAELLLEGVGKGWASRTYFSDNGSTAVEIALKMAFRKFLLDRGIHFDQLKVNASERYINLKVLALKGSYHGDTLGAMEAQAPSPYTGVYQQPWYSGRGIFLDPPTVFLCNGIWKLQLPKKIQVENVKMDDFCFNLRDEIFQETRDASLFASIYSSYISKELSHVNSIPYTDIGALIIEPVIHGAGGMEMIDPLFQRILVKECQSRNIPVIFDEVFTGFWRLGVESAAKLLCCQPDISCFAKLMTGGVVPLAVTLASEAVFEAFVGESKLKALLHGHSYSAHAIGCSAAVQSIKWFKNSQRNVNLIPGADLLRELWDTELVHQLSSHPAVKRVVTIGTLCALELRAEGCNAGYASLYATSLLKKIREDGIYTRPLGNVIYLMCGPCTSPQVCSQIMNKLIRRLDEFSEVKNVGACQP